MGLSPKSESDAWRRFYREIEDGSSIVSALFHQMDGLRGTNESEYVERRLRSVVLALGPDVESPEIAGSIEPVHTFAADPSDERDGEFVDQSIEDSWRCVCGNSNVADGFSFVSANGTTLDQRVIGDTGTAADYEYFEIETGRARDWDGRFMVCGSCGRIFETDGGRVVALDADELDPAAGEPVELEELVAALDGAAVLAHTGGNVWVGEIPLGAGRIWISRGDDEADQYGTFDVYRYATNHVDDEGSFVAKIGPASLDETVAEIRKIVETAR